MTKFKPPLRAYPEALTELLDNYDQVEAGNYRLADLITGFVDPNVAAEEAANVGENFVDEDESTESVADIDDESDEEDEAIAAQVQMTVIQITASILKWRVKDCCIKRATY